MPNLVRFGAFELDLEAAELRTDGRRSRLPEQQFQILRLLLSADGGVVSREEIRRCLWPNDTIVEFDRSINTAVMKLRLALGDTGDDARVIETLTRRGYRLMVPILKENCQPAEPPDQDNHQRSLVGQKVSHYRVLGILGGGGMGLVYKGEDLKLNRPVALKFLPEELAEDPLVAQRFEREARTASSLNHPNICTIYEVEEHEGQAFIVMELLEGETLREFISRCTASAADGPPGLDLAQLLDISLQIGDGLAAAHEKGVVHRDIKPANIFVTPSGRVKILDFGLARAAPDKRSDLPAETDEPNGTRRAPRETAVDLALTNAGTTMGTAGYMSPEQVRGEKVDARTDLFSFGLILYEMASGSHPFHGQTAFEVSSSIVRDPPAPLPARVPPSLRAVIYRCLEKWPDERYQSAAEVCRALKTVEKPQPIVGGEPSLRRPHSKRWLLVAAPVLLISLFVVLARHGLQNRFFHGNRVAVPPASAPVPVSRRSVAVLGFENASKRPETAWLSTALSEMLATELSAGDKLRIIPEENVARMERDLSLAATDTLASDTLKRMHDYLGSDLILDGGYTTLGQASGGELRLDVHLQDAATGETVASVAEAGSEIALFDLVSRVGADLRRRLGVGDLAPVDAAGVQATYPAGPDVARLYAEGIAQLRIFNSRGALDPLQKAITADPNFPLAHYALSSTWSALGYDDKARDEAKLAFEQSGSLSREDRLLVEGRYREMTQDWPVAIDVYRTLAGFYPDNPEYGLRLASTQARGGQAKDALVTITALKALPAPQNADPRISLAQATAMRWVGDPKGMLAASQTAANQAAAQGSKFVEASARLSEGSAYFNLGQKKEALAAWEESRRIWASANYPGEVAKTLLNTGTVFYETGNLPEAKKRFEEALSIWKTTGNKAGQLNALASLANLHSDEGDLARAKQMDLDVLQIAHELGGTDALTLLDLGDLQIDLGDIAGALTNDQEAEDLARHNGNRLTLSAALAHIARAYYLHGNLRNANQSVQEALDITRQTGDRSHAARSMANWGEILMAEGDLPQARNNLQNAVETCTAIGEDINADDSRLQLAALSIEDGRAADAERASRDIRDRYRKSGHPDEQIGADVVLLQALLVEGKPKEAEKELASERPLLAKSQNVPNRLAITVADAQIQAAGGQEQQALRNLVTAARDAAKYGFVPQELEARLAHATVELNSGKTAAGCAELVEVRTRASSKGFELIARKATALLTRSQSQT